MISPLSEVFGRKKVSLMANIVYLGKPTYDVILTMRSLF